MHRNAARQSKDKRSSAAKSKARFRPINGNAKSPSRSDRKNIALAKNLGLHSEEGHHEGHGLSYGAQAVQCGAFGGTERLMALVADESAFLLHMDTVIAPACLPPGRAVPIGAAYCRRLHDMFLMAVRGSVPRGACRVPFSLQVRFTYGSVQSYI
jgi:hypothetical protein